MEGCLWKRNGGRDSRVQLACGEGGEGWRHFSLLSRNGMLHEGSEGKAVTKFRRHHDTDSRNAQCHPSLTRADTDAVIKSPPGRPGKAVVPEQSSLFRSSLLLLFRFHGRNHPSLRKPMIPWRRTHAPVATVAFSDEDMDRWRRNLPIVCISLFRVTPLHLFSPRSALEDDFPQKNPSHHPA